jgi:hypothetical protein
MSSLNRPVIFFHFLVCSGLLRNLPRTTEFNLTNNRNENSEMVITRDYHESYLIANYFSCFRD